MCEGGSALPPPFSFSRLRLSRGVAQRSGNVPARLPPFSSTSCEGGICNEEGERCEREGPTEARESTDERRTTKDRWGLRSIEGTEPFINSYALGPMKFSQISARRGGGRKERATVRCRRGAHRLVDSLCNICEGVGRGEQMLVFDPEEDDFDEKGLNAKDFGGGEGGTGSPPS